MKKTITLVMLNMFFGAVMLMAQIPNTSPIPVEFRIESDDGLVRTFDYSSSTDWADTLTQTVEAELVWAYDEQSDSLLCDTLAVMTDVAGKIALVRRGDCNFTLKAYNVQEAGALGIIIVNHTYEGDPSGNGGLVNMAGGIFAADTYLPSIFITRSDGDVILEKLDAGVPVTAIFEVSAFGGARSAYSYHTPLPSVRPLEDIAITYLNSDESTTIPSITVTAEITDPSSQVTSLTTELTDVAPLSLNTVSFDSYTPDEVGTYDVKFTNSLTPDEVVQQFVITDYTFALDNGDIVPNTNGTIEPSDENFVNLYNFRYDFGNVYRIGAEPVTATHGTFMISNPDELYQGDEEADVFKVRIYNADPDGNGSVPYPAQFTSYNELNENGGLNIPIGFGEYILSEDDQPFEFITVEFNSPVTLNANGLYLLMIEYNGVAAGTGIPPKYAFAGNDRPAGDIGNVIFTDSLRTDGWGNNYNGVVRMHLDGFTISGTEEALDAGKVSVSPNPASTMVNLNLELDNVAEEITVRITDFNGRQVSIQQLENVQDGTFNFDVSNMANGTYFMTVYTPEGFRAKKFQVMR